MLCIGLLLLKMSGISWYPHSIKWRYMHIKLLNYLNELFELLIHIWLVVMSGESQHPVLIEFVRGCPHFVF